MAEGIKYALLVGVGKYNNEDIVDLPAYEADCKLVNDSLVNGLMFSQENIRTVGEAGEVTSKSFTYAILNFQKALTERDTFVLYYSGHGKDNALCFSDTFVELESIVRVVDGLPAKRKWIILDCCHSGAARTPDVVMIPKTLNLKLADFTDKGITIMASAGAEQLASFDGDHSLYTGMLCEAIMSDKTTRHGRKSLWDINDMVHYMMDEWNSTHVTKIQYPVFRSSEIGAISFNVSGSGKSLIEGSMGGTRPLCITESYIITSVRSLSSNDVKRKCAFVMLKCDNTEENIVRITKEVVLQVRRTSFDTKVIWCYFGADDSDMIKSNYFAYSIWTDDLEQRQIHFKDNRHAHIADDIYIYENASYDLVRKMNQPDSNSEEYMQSLNLAISEIINMGEMFVRDITEVYNKTLDMDVLRNEYTEWIKRVKRDYIKLSDMSSPPDEIYDYSEKVMELAGWLVDLGTYVEGDKELTVLDYWEIKNAVRRYHESIGIISKMQKEKRWPE